VVINLGKFKHLSLQEREFLFGSLKEGLKIREIARRLGRDHSGLLYELKKNKAGKGKRSHEYFNAEYIPCIAQEKADKRALKQRRKAPLKEPLIFLYVRVHLREPFCWTPEQISGTLPLEHKGKSINTETIYQYIYSKNARRYQLWTLLTHSRKKRMKQLGRSVHSEAKKGKILFSVSIEKRPKYIQRRRQIGHWETDNVIGKQTDDTALSVTVERVTRYTILSLTNRSAKEKADKLIDRLGQYSLNFRRTITTDNGSENSYHQQISDSLSLKMYFCHAYHSWEKGTVENMNGRIRRYIPKGLSLNHLTDQQVSSLEEKLNSTPRKCLGYLTPKQKLDILLKST